MVLTWKVINELFGGFLGKSLLLIALATPMSFLVNVNININLYIISLIGAIIILAGYVWSEISTPMLIKNNKNGHFYAKELIELSGYIDFVSEFKILEENKNKIPSGFDGYFYKQPGFKSISSAKTEIGEKESIRALSILKFNLVNSLNKVQRASLTMVFLIGAILIYLPLIYRVFLIMGVQF